MVVECSLGMPGTLVVRSLLASSNRKKFEVLLLCLALSILELETDWLARSQDIGLVGTSMRGVVFQWLAL